MGARYEIGELEYASGYEKMYGVTDEQLAFLSRHQDNLRRFEVEPTYDAALDADLERLARKRDELSRHGFDAAREAGSASEAFRVEFAHATTALEGNGLTLAETAMVLERDLTIPGKPLHDHLEVMDADAAFTRVRMARPFPKRSSSTCTASLPPTWKRPIRGSTAGTCATSPRLLCIRPLPPACRN